MNNMLLGEKIKTLRIKMRVSATQLGKAVGRSPTTIIEIEEGGTRDPKLSIICGIAEFLNVSMDWLTDDSSDFSKSASQDMAVEAIVRDAMASAGLIGELSEKERKLLAQYRALNPMRKPKLEGFIEGLGGDSDRRGDNHPRPQV